MTCVSSCGGLSGWCAELRFQAAPEGFDDAHLPVLSQISTDGGFMDLARHSSPARAANRLNADWPDVSNCCLRIMWATSMPSSVAEADLKDLNPFISRVNFLMKRWSCSIMLLRYLTYRTSISQNHPFKISTSSCFVARRDWRSFCLLQLCRERRCCRLRG